MDCKRKTTVTETKKKKRKGFQGGETVKRKSEIRRDIIKSSCNESIATSRIQQQNRRFDKTPTLRFFHHIFRLSLRDVVSKRAAPSRRASAQAISRAVIEKEQNATKKTRLRDIFRAANTNSWYTWERVASSSLFLSLYAKPLSMSQPSSSSSSF